MNTTSNDCVYYFLGNITSHIVHALPLFRAIGGTFVVTSHKAARALQGYNVPTIIIDDKPYVIQRFSYKIKLVHEYSHIDHTLHRTVDFLNQHAQVVIFYDLFDFAENTRITKPKTIFLTHGNMLKDYMGESDRKRKLEQYDYMAAIGPRLKERFIRKDGLPSRKLVDLGIARTDDVVKCSSTIHVSESLKEILHPNYRDNKIISYTPTFWGASSIYTTGLDIIQYAPSEYTLLFRPHPQTPSKLLKKYKRLMHSRPNVIYIPEGRYTNISIIDMFNASSAIIGDVSSVMLEAILTKKPLIFAYDTSKHKQSASEYEAIEAVVSSSQSIYPDTKQNVGTILDMSIKNDVTSDIWEKTIDDNFFHAHGDSVRTIAHFVKSLM